MWTAIALTLKLAALTTGVTSAETVWLDSLDVSVATQGWGEPHKNKSVDGHALTIGGQSFEHGFGTHAEGTLIIHLDGGAQSFSAKVGVDDEVNKNPAASVEFSVIGDGTNLWTSGVMRAGDAAKACEVKLTGVKVLALKVGDAGDGISFDHADWADAKFETPRVLRPAASRYQNPSRPIFSRPSRPQHRGSMARTSSACVRVRRFCSPLRRLANAP